MALLKILRKVFYLLLRQPCKVYGHKWQFYYNAGIPLGCKDSIESILKGFETGEFKRVDRCSVCNMEEFSSEHEDSTGYNKSIASIILPTRK